MNCPVCGVQYYADPNRLKFGRQTTCSRECSYQLRAIRATRSIECVCSCCGKKFCRAPSNIKSKHEGVYCSRACHYAGRSAGITKRVVAAPYVITEHGRAAQNAARKIGAATRKKNGNHLHSEKSKAKLRDATARAIASGKFPRVSALESIVAKELDALGVRYVRQYGIRCPESGKYLACIDFYLPEVHAALEVNGTFWHKDARVYPGVATSAQARTADRFAKKIEVLRKVGMHLIQVWERDIKECPGKAVADALFALG